MVAPIGTITTTKMDRVDFGIVTTPPTLVKLEPIATVQGNRWTIAMNFGSVSELTLWTIQSYLLYEKRESLHYAGVFQSPLDE
jgi:hypothetical protein